MGRRDARELAFKLLYQWEIQKGELEELIQISLKEKIFDEENQNCISKKDEDYILDVVKGTKNHLREIDKSIEKYLKGWKLNRISKVNLSILRLAVYEILYREDIPVSVSINEAVELAKKYESEEAGSFVNGLLREFAKSMN